MAKKKSNLIDLKKVRKLKRIKELMAQIDAEKTEREQTRSIRKFDVEKIKAKVEASEKKHLAEQSAGSFAPVTLKEIIQKHVIEYKVELTRKRMEHGLCPHCGLSLEGVKIVNKDIPTDVIP